jgi:hypothetical protein
MNKADDGLVLVLFMIVSDHAKIMHPRVLRVDRGLDQVSSGAFLDLDYHL